MRATARHREVEEGFRALLAGEALPAPDEVGYEPDSVVFYWHEPKVAVFVDFDDDVPRPRRGRASRTAPFARGRDP